ncbi:helix-turn-helix transcriptional regulator [Falsibacillus albus]|uniref:AraC family transcriptional regulator n=1 Tax=Falsibacillus albus TaxID=2478915 RepID=UPI001F303EE2|nr:AraC family transcriptional regulator [Falsibacillus albus]
MVDPSTSMIKTLMSIGFRSQGTFSTTFKRFVGQSPKQFQSRIKGLHKFFKSYEQHEDRMHAADICPPIITCQVQHPNDFKGVIFIGLFPRPIPDQKPVMGTALQTPLRNCTFTGIPEGSYYLLAAAIPWKMNVTDLFLLEKAYRGKHDSPIVVDKYTDMIVDIKLRPPLPTDPPILVNLPQLLFDRKEI